MYDALFKAFDHDKDGSVDFMEFALGLLILGGNSEAKNLEDDSLDFIFRLHDVNENGTIEKNEAEKVRFMSLTSPIINKNL